MNKGPAAAWLYSLTLIVLSSCMCCQAECRNDTRELQTDDLERYGINIQINPVMGTEIYRVDLRMQSEICIKTDETNCGLAIYAVSAASLKSGNVNKPIALGRPNPYEYAASFNLSNAQIASSIVELVFQGEKCDTQNHRRQSFSVGLDEIPITGS